MGARPEAKPHVGRCQQRDRPDREEEGPAGRHRPRRRPHRDRSLPPNLVPPHGNPLLHRQGQEPMGTSTPRTAPLLASSSSPSTRTTTSAPTRSVATGWSNHVATFPGCRRQARAHPPQGARQEAGLSVRRNCALPVTPLFSLFPLKMENQKKK